ncbi:hypothetical protein ABID22_003284 [Pontibacter aydingkolensis]|uniref:Uncharacterized protein n=1 Tax=Pontibacter aydingkolensis TaxID=1911536 RepID=A0ABS7CUU6_9BACT|nr:hypothetical protein [Pontibacter aydingkolensis]MBW7467446.1 hypothetical protein [Pontibacter aydingkolensis]
MDAENLRNKHSIQHLYNAILPELAQHINHNIMPVTALFHDFGLERVIDTWTRDPAAGDDEVVSIENGNVQFMGLKLRMEGFKRAGAGAFDMNKDLLFKLERSSYTVGPDKNTNWLEKDYTQRWETSEYEMVAAQWAEELIDAITQRLESITG